MVHGPGFQRFNFFLLLCPVLLKCLSLEPWISPITYICVTCYIIIATVWWQTNVLAVQNITERFYYWGQKKKGIISVFGCGWEEFCPLSFCPQRRPLRSSPRQADSQQSFLNPSCVVSRINIIGSLAGWLILLSSWSICYLVRAGE